MSEKSVELNDLQLESLNALQGERTRVEHDIQLATALMLAGAGVRVTKGMTFRFEPNPARIVYSVAE